MSKTQDKQNKQETKTRDLYTTKEVAEVRSLLIKEQDSKCKLTGEKFDAKDFHVDHRHDNEQLVRGALYRHSNMTLGKLESLWTRYLSFWYNGTLSDFLRQSADYLELPKDTRFRHTGWMKKIKTKFNMLNSEQMDNVLAAFGIGKQRNAVERKKKFEGVIADRNNGYDKIMLAIEQQAIKQKGKK